MVLLRDTKCPGEVGHLEDQWTGKSLQYWEGVLLLDISSLCFPPREFHMFQVHLSSSPAFLFTCLQFHFLGVTEELT